MSPGNDSLWLDSVLGPESSDALAAQLAKAGAKDNSLSAMSLFEGAVANAVKSCLHVDLLALLAEGWRTAQEIHAAKTAPGVTVLKLANHQIKREIKPVLKIDGIDKPLEASVVVAGHFKGIELSIANGAIVSVGSGHCDITLEFDLAGEALQDPTTLKDWQLPGEHRFDPPLPIP
ncbi:MAG: hypothetical protein JO261_08535 [Alphaproteobacteria bacterium]|nr:hypothetical protein [Alphaproteobacteria bacterium]MBV9693734.1 hypothetical protein [Alphaproteobacteria bacterium]